MRTPITSWSGLAPREWATLVLASLMLFSASAVRAQLGSGWIPTSFTKSIHLDDDTGLRHDDVE